MALQTKYIEAGTNNVEWKCRLVVTENSIDNSNNTSSLTLTLQFTRSRSGGYQSWVGYSTSATLSVGGLSQTVTVSAFNYSSVGVNDWKTLGSATFPTIYHMDDGTLNCTVSAYWHQTYAQPNTCSVDGYVPLTKTNGAINDNGSGSVPVTEIGAVVPQTNTVQNISTVKATNAIAGNICTITITKNSTATITHRLRYKTGNMSYSTIINTTPTSATSYSWTVPKLLGAQTINNSITCTIYLDTYCNGILIGTSNTTMTISKPTTASGSPLTSTSSKININRSVDCEANFTAKTIQENSQTLLTTYASITHSHITESGGSDGTSSTGHYIKFEDGLMICWNRIVDGTKTMTSQTTNAVYGGYGYGITFPKSFIDTPIVIANVDSNGYSNAMAAQITKTEFTLRHWMNYASSPTGVTYNYIAIGRWK